MAPGAERQAGSLQQMWTEIQEGMCTPSPYYGRLGASYQVPGIAHE